MKLIDSHAHLAALQDLAMALERAREAGICAIVNIATTKEELEFGLSLHTSSPQIFLSAATTPHDVAVRGESDFEPIRKRALEGKLDAIGETGLDYHYEHSPKEEQHHFLRKYLQLAREANLPIIFHCREAFQDLFRICDEEKYSGKALLHCFTGTLQEAKEVSARGWMLSLSGIVTFKKSEALREVAKEVPLDQLLVETDAPYLAPQRHRGIPNEPSFLVETAKCIAEVRGISLEKFAEATVANTASFFKISL